MSPLLRRAHSARLPPQKQSGPSTSAAHRSDAGTGCVAIRRTERSFSVVPSRAIPQDRARRAAVLELVSEARQILLAPVAPAEQRASPDSQTHAPWHERFL